jgi:uncharacterized protein YcbK (DUF882 family)
MLIARRSLTLAAMLAPAVARRAHASSERFIWLRNAAGEEAAVVYRDGETYDPMALALIRHVLRDLHAGAPGPLPELLVDMLSALQEQWSHTRPLIVRSGYRTPSTNASIEGAAPGSLHMAGRAVDLTVPGLSNDAVAMAVWSLSRRLGFLGLGVYPSFVHMDIGPQRVWTRWGR